MSIKFRRKIRAFTLIEIIVVIVIISVLATISYTGYQKIILRAKERDIVLTFRTIHAVNQNYRTKTGLYLAGIFLPASLDDFNQALGLDISNMDGTVEYSYSGSSPAIEYDMLAFVYRTSGDAAPMFLIRMDQSDWTLAALLKKQDFFAVGVQSALALLHGAESVIFGDSAFAAPGSSGENPCCDTQYNGCPTLPSC